MEVVSIGADALQRADFANLPKMEEVFFSMQFSGPVEDQEARRAQHLNWLFAKGFQELARGIRQSLEEAYLYVTLIKTPNGLTTLAAVQKTIADARSRANELYFPDLLSAVGDGLRERLSFASEFLSLQKVRNCLEHRNGIVGAADVRGDKALRLTLPRLGVFLRQGGQEVEVERDALVEKGGELLIKRVSREREYALGQAIAFSPADFHEIAGGCYLFANDLATKLPTKAFEAAAAN